MSPARIAAFQIALEFEQHRTRLDTLFAKENNLDHRERRFMRHLVSGSIRHLRYLDWLSEKLYRGNFAKVEYKIRVVLRLALYEINFLDAVPAPVSVNEYVSLAKKKSGQRASGLINGILRNYLRQKDELIPSNLIDDPVERIGIEYSFPDWMVRTWVKSWGVDETEKLCFALNEPPRFDLQINQSQISIEGFKALLTEHNIAFKESSYVSGMLTIDDMQTIINQNWLEQGLCSVQDESATFPVQLLNMQAEDVVLDLCAAPGGKYQQILQQKPKLAIAVDSDLKRLRRVKQNVKRLKLSGGFFVCADARQAPFKAGFSKILVDAPCSGLGVMRKHPDIKWRREVREIVEFSHLQQAILQSASALLTRKGILAYSTCTIDERENQQVADSFMQSNLDHFDKVIPNLTHKTFEQDGQFRTLPHLHHTDGSFCALFQKNT